MDLQSSNPNQQSIEQSNAADTQWSKMVPTAGHFGGTWGEEDEDLTNVWTGIPNSNNSLTHQSSQLNMNSTSASNVFNNRQPNSINCDKGNLQLLSNTNSNKNWISDDNENWGESIKTGNEWETTPADISVLNANLTPKADASAENWNFYPGGGKMNSAVVPNHNQAAGWSTEIDNKAIANEPDIDNGTSLWGNPQGQNKVLWKEENNKQGNNNSQVVINNGKRLVKNDFI